MPAAIDISGLRYGRLLVQHIDASSDGKRKWVCLCDCGNTTSLMTNKITSGHTTSCGCYRAETTKTNGRKNVLHGRTRTGDLTYSSWCAMRYRCNDKENVRYGGRGITYCQRWNSFDLFLQDMGERPEGTTLDRIDPNGNYEPSNCRWATAKHQQRNRGNTRYIYIGGEKVNLMDVADKLGIKKTAAQYYFSVAKILEEYYECTPSVKDGRAVAG